jgi:UDP-3-O-[3-hydroxymyristoyl] glucosamine N-acyltransferase
MPDPRFYDVRGPITLRGLAELTGARLADPRRADMEIMAVAPLGRADGSSVSYVSDRKFLAEFAQTAAGAAFTDEVNAASAPAACALLLTPQPHAAYALASDALHHIRVHPAGSPLIHPDAELEADVRLTPGVVVGPGARIGAGTDIGANAVIGPGVTIGRECVIGSNVVIGFALIGDRVRVLSGAVIGGAGFGVAIGASGAIDAPQLGRVILQDGVTVGACSCIDRGGYEDTVVGENTKIDNLVQIGHNVRIGRSCVLAAQTGIAGSVVVGDLSQFGGKAGVGDHVIIGERVRLAAGALAMRDIPDGETWCGQPARPIRKFMREVAWVSRRANARKEGGGS